MTASRSAREKKAGQEAGPLARVRIDLDAHQQFVYKISCTDCVVERSSQVVGLPPRR